ncbi:MAG: hypothetical protein PF637_09155 [Spirochaetes bacterium]|nr:hypothetical protein [Spirochaetota bacterium]
MLVLLFEVWTNPLLAKDSWNLFERKGIIQYNEEMYDFAEEHLHRALDMNPNAHRSAKYLGLLYNYRGDYNKALHYFLVSVKINEKQDDANYLAGEIYDRKAQTVKALYHFEKSLEANPDYYKSHIGAARIYSLHGNYEKAENHINAAYEINREKSTPLFEAAKQKRTLKSDRSIAVLLEKALEVNPADREIYYELSSVYRSLKEYRSAIYILERLKYYIPHEERSYVHIANIYHSERVLQKRHDDYRAALFNIEKALQMSPDNLQYLELAEELYRLNGLDEEADKTAQRVLELTQKLFSETE